MLTKSAMISSTFWGISVSVLYIFLFPECFTFVVLMKDKKACNEHNSIDPEHLSALSIITATLHLHHRCSTHSPKKLLLLCCWKTCDDILCHECGNDPVFVLNVENSIVLVICLHACQCFIIDKACKEVL